MHFQISDSLTTAFAISVTLVAAMRTLLTHFLFDIGSNRAVAHTGVFVKEVLLLTAQTVVSTVLTRGTSFCTAMTLATTRVTPVEKQTNVNV